MTTTATDNGHDSTAEHVLFVAFAPGEKTWKSTLLGLQALLASSRARHDGTNACNPKMRSSGRGKTRSKSRALEMPSGGHFISRHPRSMAGTLDESPLKREWKNLGMIAQIS